MPCYHECGLATQREYLAFRVADRGCAGTAEYAHGAAIGGDDDPIRSVVNDDYAGTARGSCDKPDRENTGACGEVEIARHPALLSARSGEVRRDCGPAGASLSYSLTSAAFAVLRICSRSTRRRVSSSCAAIIR